MTTTPDAPRTRPAAPEPKDAELSLGSAAGAVRAALTTGGEILRFSWQVTRSLPEVRAHWTEVVRQAAILVLSSALIIWAMQFVMGTMCGTEAIYTLKQVGAPIYSGIFNAWCAVRELVPYMWGYILAAKIGCGLVAEIGSMRIAEEVDALEVMGVDSRSYLVGTRVVAAWLSMPFLYAVSLGMMSLGEILVTVYYVGGVSPGGHMYIFWLYQNPLDFLYSMIKGMTMGTAIVFVACYYGYTVRGGSVEVGKNTARSMVLNMVLIHMIGALGTQLFWGLSPNAPIGN
ncbi:phospholipid/cholesterol/gamma-HCH transport system permease protein [Nocardioides aromaticivorans]|uniref:ABC transporter permease n=1 Tax=Nocardioides aromaticivorans TaxID=200618 RepID=A0A7Z0CMF0_9ACTN|nr:ABC transporter permease [Nocardioides aromaticivorans]NYI46244.1 phospholipid/cholesterol/gamma-HCH transport system permease protein [Nocardioides aromaticivorans]QSR25371.1 ABC transporter permease [Nocardioides aromaticivorans]